MGKGFFRTFVFASALAFTVAGCGGDVTDRAGAADGDTTSSVQDSADTPADEETDEPVDEETSEPADEETSEPADAAPEQVDVTIDDFGFTAVTNDFDDSVSVSWAVVVTNPNDDVWIASGIDLNITFLDDAGSVVESVSDQINFLLPGQTGAAGDSTYDSGEVAEMRVQARVRDWEEGEGPFGAFTTSGVSVANEEFGGWKVTGTVASSFEEDFTDPIAVAVLRDDAGEIVGGGYTFLDFVPAGGDTSFQVDVFEEVAGVASADVYVMLSNLSMFD